MQAEGLAARDNIAATRASLDIALSEVERSIKNTKNESKMTEQRTSAAEEQKTKVSAEITEIEEHLRLADARCEALKSDVNSRQVQKSVVSPFAQH